MRRFTTVKFSIAAVSVAAIGVMASPIGMVGIWAFPR